MVVAHRRNRPQHAIPDEEIERVMIITKKHLPRRTFLRGLGVSLALPLLDSMVPAFTALSATAAKPIKRLGIVYVPNGVFRTGWTPEGNGELLELPSTLKPLTAFRER